MRTKEALPAVGSSSSSATTLTSGPPKVNRFDAAAGTLCSAFDVLAQHQLFRDPSDDIDPPEEQVFIASWVDYCNKYGMGYALTDGSVGMHFNDSCHTSNSSETCFICTDQLDGETDWKLCIAVPVMQTLLPREL